MRPQLLHKLSLVAGALALAVSAACIYVHKEDDGWRRGDNDASEHEAQGEHLAHHLSAMARIEGRSGSQLRGSAHFLEVPGGVEVRIEVTKAPPGWHAVHVHQNGDCSADDGSSAGGHFNPSAMDHGSPLGPTHHAGDLGNMWVDADGNGHHVILMSALTVADGPNSVRGRGIIVHADLDDMLTQPTGNAGGRIGCGVIQ